MIDTITFTTAPCMVCGATSEVSMTRDGYEQWRTGTLLQIACPEMTKENRELAIPARTPRAGMRCSPTRRRTTMRREDWIGWSFIAVALLVGVWLLTWHQLHPSVEPCIPAVAVDYRNDGTSIAGWYDGNNDLVLAAVAEDEYEWCDR